MSKDIVLINEDEIELALAAFYETLARKRAAFDTGAAGLGFTPKDFGIPQLETMIARLEGEENE